MGKSMSFSVDGSFITNLAREKLYYNHDLKAAIDLLMSCTMTSEMNDLEHLKMVIDILEYRKEIRGVYPNDDYGVFDAKNPGITKTIAGLIRQMDEKLQEAKADTQKMAEKLCFINEHLSDYKLSELNEAWNDEMYDPDAENNDPGSEPWLFPDHASAQEDAPDTWSAIASMIASSDYSDPKAVESVNQQAAGLLQKEKLQLAGNMLDDYLLAAKYNIGDDYGWLSPTGEFHPVEWGEHQGWAADYMKTHPDLFGLPEDRLERDDVLSDMMLSMNAGDKLTEKGWILLHSTSHGIARPTRDESRRITKAQREFLYGYYTDRNLNDMANAYMED